MRHRYHEVCRIDRRVHLKQFERMQREEVDLRELFENINFGHFDGFLDAPALKWNSRLRSSAGRFIPGSRHYPEIRPPAIEVASYLLEEPNAKAFITDTMAHEMIHYWLWVRRKPYGHTAEFLQKMTMMGVSRYNPVPRTRPFKYIYRCSGCQTEFPARRRLGLLACAKCCKVHAGGKFDLRFKLELFRSLATEEVVL